MMGRNVLVINQLELRRALQFYLSSGILNYSEREIVVVNVTMDRTQQRCTIIFDPRPKKETKE